MNFVQFQSLVNVVLTVYTWRMTTSNISISNSIIPVLCGVLILLGSCSKTEDFKSLKAEAMAQVGAGEYSKAREGLQKALKFKPTDKDVLLYLGIANQALEQFDTAVSYFRKVTKLYGPEEETSRRMVASSVALGDWEKAIEGLENVAKSGVERSDLFPQFYELYMNAGFYQAGSNVLDSMIKLTPERKKLYLRSATAKGLLGEYGKAEMILQEAIRRFGPSVEAYSNMGVLKMQQDQHKKGEIFFRKAYKIDTTRDDALLNLGNCLSSFDSKDKKREALGYYNRISKDIFDGMRLDTVVAKLELELQD
jgi:tetratricopeptide (TPR) repeat protein